MLHLNTSLMRSSLALAAVLGATHSFAQDRPVVLHQIGDTLSLGDRVTQILHPRIADNGDHIYMVNTDDPAQNSALIFNGNEILRKLDVLPGGATVEAIQAADLSNSGRILMHLTVDTAPGGTVLPEVLIYQGMPFLWEGKRIDNNLFGADSRVDEIQFAQINDNHQVLVRCVVFSTNDQTTQAALVRYDLDPMGNILVEDVLIREPTIPVGQSFQLRSISAGETRAGLSNAGGFVWCGQLDPAAGNEDRIVYHNLTNEIAQSNTPSPIPGRDWDDFASAPVTINNANQWGALLHLDDSDFSNQALIAVDETVIYREGDSLPYDPSETLVSFSNLAIDLSDSGEVCYYARWGALGSLDEGIFIDDEAVCLPGETVTASGETVGLIAQTQEAFRMSDDGSRIMYFAFLDNGPLALLLAQREVGNPYCSATTNSSGQASSITAAGSTDVSLNALNLTTSGLPLNTNAFMIGSMTQGFVVFPGNSQGHLCLGGSIARFMNQIQNSGATGTTSIWINLNNIPIMGGTAVQPGDSWSFQEWHRDVGGSNFSLPVEVVFD